jgi:hypothetical protein
MVAALARPKLWPFGRPAPRLAAILLEPLQGEGGIRPGEEEFFKVARELCDQVGRGRGWGRPGALTGAGGGEVQWNGWAAATTHVFLCFRASCRNRPVSPRSTIPSSRLPTG